MAGNYEKCAQSASPVARAGGGDISERELSRERYALQTTPTTRCQPAHPKKQLFSAPVSKFTASSGCGANNDLNATLGRLRDCLDEYSTPMALSRPSLSMRSTKAVSMEDLTPTKRIKRESDCEPPLLACKKEGVRMVSFSASGMSREAAAARVARFMAVSAWRRRRDEVRCLRKTLEFQVGCSEKLRLQVRALKSLVESDNGKVKMAIREIERLKQLLREKEQERIVLQKEKLALEEDVCAAEDRASEMSVGWHNCRNELEGVRAAVAVCEHALALERAAVNETRAQRDHYYARLELVMVEVSRCGELLAAAEAEGAESAARRDQLELAFHDTADRLAAETRAHERCAQECASLSARASLASYEVAALKAMVESLRADLATATAELAEARDRLRWWPRPIHKLMNVTRSWIRQPGTVPETVLWLLLLARPSW